MRDIKQRTPHTPRTNAELEVGICQVDTLLTKARIVLYKVDPITPNACAQATDLGVPIDAGATLGTAGINQASEQPQDEVFNFNVLAFATWGTSLYRSNDLTSFIRESLDRSNEYYTLSYVPTDLEDRLHALRVIMHNPALHHAAAFAPLKVRLPVLLRGASFVLRPQLTDDVILEET
ncbi:MAG: hypothetical protein ACRYFU_02000 [Janthinobacterium lividum]